MEPKQGCDTVKQTLTNWGESSYPQQLEFCECALCPLTRFSILARLHHGTQIQTNTADRTGISLKGKGLGAFIRHTLISLKLLLLLEWGTASRWCTQDRLWQPSIWCMEIKGLFSVGGDRRHSWKVENLRLMRIWPTQTVSGAFLYVFFCGFVPLFLDVAFKCCAVYAESQQGCNNRVLPCFSARAKLHK